MPIQTDEELAALPERSPRGPSSPEDLRIRCEFYRDMVIRDMGGLPPGDDKPEDPEYWDHLLAQLKV